VVHGHVVATAETFTVVFSSAGRDVGMTILIPIVHIWSAVVIEVLACALDSIVKTLALNLTKLPGRGIPTVFIVILGKAGRNIA
jgi:hypothetical protein